MSVLGQNTGINRRAVGTYSSSTLKATQNSDNSHQELTCTPPALGSTIGQGLWRLEPWPLWRAKGTWTCGCIWVEQEEQLSVPAQAACWRQPRSLFAADMNWESNTGSSLLQFFPPLGWRSQGWERRKPSQREQNHSGLAARAFPPAVWDQGQFSSVQSLSHVWLFVTPQTAAHQASLSITNSRSLLKLMSIKSVMPSNHLWFCCPLLLLPSIFPSIRVFSNESVLRIRWPKYWSFSFSISPSNEYSGLISFRMGWLDLLVVQRTFKSLLQHPSSKASIFLALKLSL